MSFANDPGDKIKNFIESILTDALNRNPTWRPTLAKLDEMLSNFEEDEERKHSKTAKEEEETKGQSFFGRFSIKC